MIPKLGNDVSKCEHMSNLIEIMLHFLSPCNLVFPHVVGMFETIASRTVNFGRSMVGNSVEDVLNLPN